MPEIAFNADCVAELVRAKDIACEVFQSGGGCATIGAGQIIDGRFRLLVGPGTYGWGHRPSVFADGELYIGPDDDGATWNLDALAAGCRTDQDVADLIVMAIRALPVQPHFDLLQEAGFDGTMMGAPRQR
jgi:hypothetical protein